MIIVIVVVLSLSVNIASDKLNPLFLLGRQSRAPVPRDISLSERRNYPPGQEQTRQTGSWRQEPDCAMKFKLVEREREPGRPRESPPSINTPTSRTRPRYSRSQNATYPPPSPYLSPSPPDSPPAGSLPICDLSCSRAMCVTTLESSRTGDFHDFFFLAFFWGELLPKLSR